MTRTGTILRKRVSFSKTLKSCSTRTVLLQTPICSRLYQEKPSGEISWNTYFLHFLICSLIYATPPNRRRLDDSDRPEPTDPARCSELARIVCSSPRALSLYLSRERYPINVAGLKLGGGVGREGWCQIPHMHSKRPVVVGACGWQGCGFNEWNPTHQHSI